MDEPCHQKPVERTARWVLVGFLAVTVFFLITEHQAHVLGVLPLLLLLACPLMHVVMHGRHGSHRQPQTQVDAVKSAPQEIKP